jgi:hypothetical protein
MTTRRIVFLAITCIVFGALVWLVREVRRVPGNSSTQAGTSEVAPLTDVAPRTRAAPGVDRWSTDLVPSGSASGMTPEVAPLPVVPPADLPDPSQPPQWTPPLAIPGDPMPPDPFEEPPIAVDPNRGREDDGETAP